jgi:tetratricopeptide (TPR) repeat protein
MKRVVAAFLGMALAASLGMAQKQPRPKSQKEVDALMAIQNAQDPDARIAAVDNLLTKFADTEFKSFALLAATEAARQKNDFVKILLYGERTLEADPNSFAAMIMMSTATSQTTKEFDLDKEEKLGRAEKLAKQALEVLKTAPKMNPQMTDEQWATAKKDFEAQGHEALGMAAMGRKKYDEAAKEFKLAVDSNGDPASMVRLGTALSSGGKYDEAVAVFEKVMAMPDLHPAVKQVAQAERARAIQNKGAKK